MVQSIRRVGVSLAFLLVLLCGMQLAGCRRNADTIASYRGGVITNADLEQRILSDPKTRSGPPKGVERSVWEERMVRQMALERLLVPDGALIPEEGTLLRPGAWRTIMVTALMEREGMRRVSVPDDSVRAFYDAHWAEFYLPEGVVFQHVLIPCEPGNASQCARAAATADTVARMARSGAEFEQLVDCYSKSESRGWRGKVGTMYRGQLPTEVEGVVFSRGPGEIGGPLATAVGFHVFKVIERVPGRLPDFQEVAAVIRRNLENEQLASMKRAYIETLTEDFRVTLRPDAYFGTDGDTAVVLRADRETVIKRDLQVWLQQHGHENASREEVAQVLEGIAVDARLLMKARDLGLANDPMVRERYCARRAGAYVDSVLAARTSLTELSESVLQRHFDEHPSRFMTPKTWHAREIAIGFGEDRYEAWTRALEVAERARRGEDFGALARAHSSAPSASQGGDLGALTLHETGRRGPEFQKLILGLTEGSVSEAVKTDQGYLILKLEEVHEPVSRTFVEAADFVRSDYLSERRDSLVAGVARDVLASARFQYFGVQE